MFQNKINAEFNIVWANVTLDHLVDSLLSAIAARLVIYVLEIDHDYEIPKDLDSQNYLFDEMFSRRGENFKDLVAQMPDYTEMKFNHCGGKLKLFYVN